MQSGLNEVIRVTKDFSKTQKSNRKKLFLCGAWLVTEEAKPKVNETGKSIMKNAIETEKGMILVNRQLLKDIQVESDKAYPTVSANQKTLIDKHVTPTIKYLMSLTQQQ